jgi:hypothetical protein
MLPKALRRAHVFLAALVIGSVWCGTKLFAAPPDQQTTRPQRPVVADDADNEDRAVELDPVLRLQLLSAILIVSPDDVRTFTVTRAPNATSPEGSTGSGSEVTIQGGPAPHAPEPASLVLGAVGTALALVAGVVWRRRRRMNAEG